jgi:hypothetical protein
MFFIAGAGFRPFFVINLFIMSFFCHRKFIRKNSRLMKRLLFLLHSGHSYFFNKKIKSIRNQKNEQSRIYANISSLGGRPGGASALYTPRSPPIHRNRSTIDVSSGWAGKERYHCGYLFRPPEPAGRYFFYHFLCHLLFILARFCRFII